jgi:hypothetical protein
MFRANVYAAFVKQQTRLVCARALAVPAAPYDGVQRTRSLVDALQSTNEWRRIASP